MSDHDPDNREDNEYGMNADSNGDQGHDNMNADLKSRQTNDDREEQKEGLYRRSPRLAGQLRVTYRDGRRSHQRTDSSSSRSPAAEAQQLISEVDNSSSFLHLNVHTTFVLGVVSLVILIIILLLLPCFCCKNMGRMCCYCCSGCATEMQPIRPRPSTPWGGWPPIPFRAPSSRPPYSQQDLEAYKSALPPQLHNSQGPPMHSQLPRPRPLSEPTWANEIKYPPVPVAPPNSREPSCEDLP